MVEFKKFIDSTSLNDIDKESIKFMVNFLKGKQLSEFADKTFLLEGEPGVGKTYLVEEVVKHLNLPVIYLGQAGLNFKDSKKAGDLAEVLKLEEKMETGIIFLDDLRYVLDFEGELEEMSEKEKKNFMRLLERLKKTEKKIVLIMTLNESHYINDSWLDRIEVKIKFNLPSQENKFNFLKEKFGNYAGLKDLEYMAKSTLGYSYRDIPQLIKIAYRSGGGKIDIDCIKKALQVYRPSSLTRANVSRGIKLGFKEVVGNDIIKKELSKLLVYRREKEKLNDFGIKKANLIIFSGSPGVGKTYMATALAGELEIPLVKINALDIFRRDNPLGNLSSIMGISERFGDCIVFIDDADKIMGSSPMSFGEEGPVIAQLINKLDSEDIKGIVILAVNNLNRLGSALRDRCSVIEFPLPSPENRKDFIRMLASKSSLNLNIEDWMVSMTEGMNYRQIQRIWNECIFYYIQNNEINLEILKDIVSEDKLRPSSYRSSMIG